MFLVLLKVDRDFVAEDATTAVNLADNVTGLGAGEDDLLGLLAHQVAGHAARLCQAHQQVHVVVKSNLCRR